ncbi:MAG TPA: hypothetical protein VNH11_31550 [Pirellulales bacterium]|nr:hypothetical protein [Pirellulales bacterium]
MAPLRVDLKPRGIVEIVQRRDAPPATQHGYLKFVQQMCELANGYLKGRK